MICGLPQRALLTELNVTATSSGLDTNGAKLHLTFGDEESKKQPDQTTNDIKRKKCGHVRASTSLSVALARGESDDVSGVEHFSETAVVCDESRDDA